MANGDVPLHIITSKLKYAIYFSPNHNFIAFAWSGVLDFEVKLELNCVFILIQHTDLQGIKPTMETFSLYLVSVNYIITFQTSLHKAVTVPTHWLTVTLTHNTTIATQHKDFQLQPTSALTSPPHWWKQSSNILLK